MHLCGACVIYMDKMFLVDSWLFGHRVAEQHKIFVVGQEFSHACQTVDMGDV